MPLAFLTVFGYFLVSSFFGWPLFVHELLRYRLRVRHNVAGASAFLGTLASFVMLAFIDSKFRVHHLDLGWWGWAIPAVWLYGPFVLWFILRLRRPRITPDGQMKT
jgi:hypothetical protein